MERSGVHHTATYERWCQQLGDYAHLRQCLWCSGVTAKDNKFRSAGSCAHGVACSPKIGLGQISRPLHTSGDNNRPGHDGYRCLQGDARRIQGGRTVPHTRSRVAAILMILTSVPSIVPFLGFRRRHRKAPQPVGVRVCKSASHS